MAALELPRIYNRYTAPAARKDALNARDNARRFLAFQRVARAPRPEINASDVTLHTEQIKVHTEPLRTSLARGAGYIFLRGAIHSPPVLSPTIIRAGDSARMIVSPSLKRALKRCRRMQLARSRKIGRLLAALLRKIRTPPLPTQA